MTGQEQEQKRPERTLPEALEAAPRLVPPTPAEPTVTPIETVTLDKVHADFASFHEGYVRHYIALADTKAGVIFTLTAGIIGYLLNNDDIRGVIHAPTCSATFVIPILALLSLGIAAAAAFLVIAPSLASPSKEGLVFFGAVSKKATGEEFVRDVANATEQDLSEARLKHCYNTATVCTRKYNFLKVAIWFTLPGLFSSLLLMLLK